MVPNSDPIPPRPVPPPGAEYGAVLAEQLRVAGLPEDRVRVVVADVLEHVRATGEDPVEAFGQPADYAARWVRPLGPGRILVRLVASVVGVLGAYTLVLALVTTGGWAEPVTIRAVDAYGIGAVAVVVAVLPWTVDLWSARRSARRFGAAQVPAVARVAAVVALLAAFVLVGSRSGWADSEVTLVTVQRWVLLVVGLLTAPLLFVVREPRSPAVPPPPGRPVGRWERVRTGLLGEPSRR